MADEKKVEIGESRSVKMLTRKVASLAIKLSRIFEFNIKDGVPAMLSTPAVCDVSYLAKELGMFKTTENTVKLSPRHEIKLPPGITMIIGRSGTGKTKLALERMTAMNDNVVYARHGEPLDKFFVELMDGDADTNGVMLLPFEADVANAIANFLFQDGTDVFIIDSLRYLFYSSSGGSTGKGGVNMSLFADISYLDNVVNLRGKSLVVVVNPLNDDDASYKSIIEAANGSVSALIDMQSTTSLRYTSRYAGRDFASISLPETARNEQIKQQLKATSSTSVSLKSIIR